MLVLAVGVARVRSRGGQPSAVSPPSAGSRPPASAARSRPASAQPVPPPGRPRLASAPGPAQPADRIPPPGRCTLRARALSTMCRHAFVSRPSPARATARAAAARIVRAEPSKGLAPGGRRRPRPRARPGPAATRSHVPWSNSSSARSPSRSAGHPTPLASSARSACSGRSTGAGPWRRGRTPPPTQHAPEPVRPGGADLSTGCAPLQPRHPLSPARGGSYSANPVRRSAGGWASQN